MTLSVSAASMLEYATVRGATELLAAPLSTEDQTVQSMPDASPTSWHRAHTTWFFETFLLGPHVPGYEPVRPEHGYLFNSYYEAVGPRHTRAERGMITRPGVAEITDYRDRVDDAMLQLLDGRPAPAVTELVTLGLHHEQQHQELIVMDIKHLLARHPFPTGYGELPWAPAGSPPSRAARWVEHDVGIVEVGHAGGGFAFDNEGPRHETLLRPFAIADRLVTVGDWLAFVDDGGYRRPELWMSAGWAEAQARAWQAPEYWHHVDGAWQVVGLDGPAPLEPEEPVEHVSWFEADAFARWAGARLPLESEWEVAAPEPDVGEGDWYGHVWQWTASQYQAYPGFRPAPGAVGEYNGKFMANQHVLRGSCAATPPKHARRTYRNFFPAHARWLFGGLRLARDLDR